MLAIKFRKNKRILNEDKIHLVFKILNMLCAKNKEIYHSDYSFEISESKICTDWIDDSLIRDEKKLNNLDFNKYITILADYNSDKIRVEIIPNKARERVKNCSHIDFNLDNESNFYKIFDDSKLLRLKEILESYKKIISEYYFYDLNINPNCYSDYENRIYQKYYDEIEFAEILIDNRLKTVEDRILKKEELNYAVMFVKNLFSKDSENFVKSLTENLDAHVSIGSFEICGNDSEKVFNDLKQKLLLYVDKLRNQNKEKYKKEFQKVFKK
jgi:hypothetical protein